MKYTYKLLHKYIPRLNNLSDMLLNPKEDNDEFDDIIIGGYFYPDDNKSQINLTSDGLIRDNIDKVNANNNYLASFFGDNVMNNELSSYDDKINYIGKWTSNIDANANIYYVIVDNQIRKIILVNQLNQHQCKIHSVLSILSKMMEIWFTVNQMKMIFYLIIYLKQKNILKNKRNYLIL